MNQDKNQMIKNIQYINTKKKCLYSYKKKQKYNNLNHIRNNENLKDKN